MDKENKMGWDIGHQINSVVRDAIAKHAASTGSTQSVPSTQQPTPLSNTSGLAAQTVATNQVPSQVEVPRGNGGYMFGSTNTDNNGLAYMQSMQNSINNY